MASTSINLPKMSLNMEEGTIVSWLVKEGQHVQKGDVLLEVQTDKTVAEVETNAEGYIGKIIAHDGETVSVGASIGILVEDMKDMLEEKSTINSSVTKAVEEVTEQKPLPQVEKRPNVKQRFRISPVARRVMNDNNLEPEQLEATGPVGRIVLRDVYRALEQSKKITHEFKKSNGIIEKVTAIRKAIALNLTNSVRDIPQFTIVKEVPVAQMESARLKMNEFSKGDTRLSVNDFLIKAIADTIVVHSKFNNYYIVRENEHYIQKNEAINIGLAVATEKGLFVPVIRNVESKSLVEIMKERKRLVEKTKLGKLTPDEMSGATFTISSLGAFNIKQFTAIINPPESGILAVGQVEEHLYLEESEVKTQKRLHLTASFDHRLIDGADGAQFMNTLEEVLAQENWKLF